MNDFVPFYASSGSPSGAGIADVIIAGLQSAAQSYQSFLGSQRGVYYPQITGASACPQGYYRNAQGLCVPLAGTSVLGTSGNSLMLILLVGAAAILAVVLIKK